MIGGVSLVCKVIIVIARAYCVLGEIVVLAGYAIRPKVVGWASMW